MEVGNRGLWKNMKNQSFWRFFVTKSVGLRLPELLISASDAEFWDLSFAMGPGAWFLCKYMTFLKNVRKGGPKVEKKVKCLTKWVRLAPIGLKLCRNDQAMIRTSKMLVLANFSKFFEGKHRFFFFLPPLPPPELTIFPVCSRTNGWPPAGHRPMGVPPHQHARANCTRLKARSSASSSKC